MKPTKEELLEAALVARKRAGAVVECSCQDWQECWHEIIAAQTLAWLHDQPYTGKVARYCPWCGKELTECDENT